MVNEQIKEIMRQACKQSMRPESVLEDVPQDVLAKFAELLVKECIDVLEFPSAMKFDAATLSECSEYSQGWVNGRKLGIEHIEKHFGVEE